MKNDAIIVGLGHTRFGRMDALSFEDLVISAAREAIEDAGLDAKDIDGVWLGHYNSGLVSDSFASSMVLAADPDLRYKPATRCENACASGSAGLYSAMDAVNAGRCRIALVVGAEKMTGLDTAGVTRALGGASYQKEEAALSFPDIFAKHAIAYRDRYTDPTEAMAHIAVKNHSNAMANPLAQMRREMTLDFCLKPSEKNPFISSPLKVTDCSLISDGAAAVVIVHRDLIRNFRRGVGFRAAEHVSDLLPLSTKILADFEGPRRAVLAAYHKAGISVDHLSFAEVHDCFTIAELLSVEALQLAEPGQGAAAVIEGQTARDGKLPVNLSGGLKAKGHPVGATGVSMHVMAARQLVNEAGDMQLPTAELGLCFNMGGGAVASYVSVLERVH